MSVLWHIWVSSYKLKARRTFCTETGHTPGHIAIIRIMESLFCKDFHMELKSCNTLQQLTGPFLEEGAAFLMDDSRPCIACSKAGV